MSSGIVAVERKRVRGGVEVTSFRRSDRGTKYRSDSIVIIDVGLTKEEMRAEIATATVKLLEN